MCCPSGLCIQGLYAKVLHAVLWASNGQADESPQQQLEDHHARSWPHEERAAEQRGQNHSQENWEGRASSLPRIATFEGYTAACQHSLLNWHP